MSLRSLFIWGLIFCRFSYAGHVTEISSALLFHVGEIEDEWKSERVPSICFTDDDENALWNSLLIESDYDSRVEKAYVLFNEAKKTNCIDLLKQSSDELRNVWRESEPDIEEKLAHDPLSKNHHYPITQEAREEIAPYLLPPKHKLAGALDAIFTKSRATKNMHYFESAGFNVLHIQPRSFIIVASHRKLPGHLVKVYLDDEERMKRNRPGWKWFVYRCKGARKIAKIIEKYKIKHFAVPIKYIYVLPENPPAPRGEGYKPKIAILLVEDMNILDADENEEHWKKDITEEHLLELYTIISRANGSSYRAGNIPCTKSGKFAFIDTEYPYQDPDFKSIRFYLSRDMRDKWDSIVRHGGKLNR